MQEIKKNPIIIIDGTLYLYYYYYGFRNFKDRLEQSSSAIYGILKMISNLLKKYVDSKKLVIIFDSFKKTFRNKLFPEYKSHRPAMPHALHIQIEPLFKILKKIGVKVLTIPGVEADDIIGTLVNKLEKEKEKILIVSHDKDMLQLVTNNIYILHKKNNCIITPETIKEKYGIRPKEFIDFLALIGDTSDNIPGVPKIGKKTALFLIQKFSNIRNIYYNIEKIPFLKLRNAKNIYKQLINNKKIALLSYQLVKIKIDIPIEITEKEIFLERYCSQKISNFFKNINF